jgi:hypothetical protein
MIHLYAKISEQQPMLIPILELESDPCSCVVAVAFTITTCPGSLCC